MHDATVAMSTSEPLDVRVRGGASLLFWHSNRGMLSAGRLSVVFARWYARS